MVVMRANAATFPLRNAGQDSSARCGIAGATAALTLLAASAATLAQASDAIEAPLDIEETQQISAGDGASPRQQPAQSLIGRIDPASASAAPSSLYLPTLSVERSRLLPSSRDWPGGSSVDAFGRPYTEMGGLSYRWWLGRGRANVGVGFGTVGYLVPPVEGPGAGPHSVVYSGPHTLAHAAPTVTVGVRYQVDDRSTVFADALGARRTYAEERSDFYSTKVGVEWKERKSRFGLEKGALGIQLDSGMRMSLKARKGGVGVYLRRQF
jgi:opacity protein-like surface antigen